MPGNTLPVILLSAQDSRKAKELALDLVDNKETSNVSDLDDVIWHLKNKYYCADVRIHPLGDDDKVPSDMLHLVEAHIIYISEQENNVVGAAEKRAAVLKEADVDVYLVLYEGSSTPSELAAWACNNYYEVVPLKETEMWESDEERDPDKDEDGPFKETYGIERARDALHAHTWSGLQRIDLPAQIQSFDGLALSSDEDWVGDDNEEDMGGDMTEQAEAFAMALEAILQAKEMRGEGDDETRRRRAEGAVNALRRALGPDFDQL